MTYDSDILVSVRMLSHVIPITLTPPYTIFHLREELLYEEELEGKGVEHLSLYNVDGRCQLDDDIVLPDEEYSLFIHTKPIVRYYIEDTDEIRELEVEHTTIKEAYDAFWKSCSEEELFSSTDDYYYLTLREGGMWLYYTDEMDDLLGKEICVKMYYDQEPRELE
jgi:hypothetical protein